MSSAKMKMLAWVRNILLCLLLMQSAAVQAQTSDLVSKSAFRVCADPANYPMSDQQGRGFENKIAELFAERLGLPLEYTWYPLSTGFVRNNLRANKCDVVIGYAQGHELVLNTNHYFTSTYVLVVPKDSALAQVETLADPALAGLKIGVVAGTPPATHLAHHGLIGTARPYQLFADRRYMNPVGDMLADLNAGELDAGTAWGPLAGPLVKEQYPNLKVIPLIHETAAPRLFFRITMGVRKGEKVWSRKLNSLIRRNQADINAILFEAGVPLVNDMATEILEPGQ